MAKVFLISLIIPLVFLSLSLKTMNDYGETTDEKFDQHIGEFYYYDWKTQGFDGLNQRFIELQRNYGPLFDVVVVTSNDLFYRKLHLIQNPVASYHFPVILVATLTIWLTFILAYLNFGLWPALLSSLTLSLMPRFIGESQNNLKDTPTMAFFTASLLFYFLALKKDQLKWYLAAGAFLGLTYAIKINGLLILPIVGLFGLLQRTVGRRSFYQIGLKVLLSLITTLAMILLAWPYYRYNPVRRFVETYLTFKNHVWNEYVLYLGQHFRGHELPWHYPWIMLGVTTPVFYLLFILIGLCLTIYLLLRNTHLGLTLVFFWLWVIIPPISQVLSGASMYDGIRHFLVILPAIVLIIGFAIWQVGVKIANLKSKYKRLFLFFYILFVTVNYVNIFRKNRELHPYQIVYFNELIGGVRGAKGKFDLEYWGSSLKEAAEWINRNLPTGSRIWLTLPFTHHFPVDRDRFVLTNEQADYKVNLIRGMLKTWDPEDNYLHPRRQPIYAIEVDGANILEIFKLKTN